MTLVDPDILRRLTRTPDPGFEVAFHKIQHPQKDPLRSFLIYLDKVLNFMLSREVEGLRCTHLHFPDIDMEYKDILLEFLIIRTFYRSLDNDQHQDNYIQERITSLNRKLINNQVPVEASGKKGGNNAYKNWLAEKKGYKKEMDLLNLMEPDSKSLWPDTIINLLVGSKKTIDDNLYAMTLEQLDNNSKRAYCLLNTDLSRDQLFKKLHLHGRLRSIRQVILFDCEGKKMFRSGNKRMLENLPQEQYAMKDLVIFSFDKKPFRIQNLLNRLNHIYKNYFVPAQEALVFKYTHIVQEAEMDELVASMTASSSVEWIGERSELFADYMQLVSTYGLYRLGAPSVLNSFAASLDRRVSDQLLADLFGEDVTQALFNADTRAAVNTLNRPEKAQLKAAIAGLLQLIQLEWEKIKEEISKQEGRGSVGIVIPFSFTEYAHFRRELKELLPETRVNFYTWKDIRDTVCPDKIILVLSYRDAGRYPFTLYPSLMEKGTNRGRLFKSLLLKMFFGDRYDRHSYFYHNILGKLLKSEFRYQYLDWKGVEARIKAMRPVYQEPLPEEEEGNDELVDVAESIKVEFVDESHATFYPSRSLILREDEDGPLSVVRADELPEETDGWFIQPLDEMYKDLNLFQITPDQEQELQQIKRDRGVSDPDHALWKVMLSRKLNEGMTEIALFEKIGNLFGELDFVRFEYFRDYWLDAKSALLIPRRRRHFRLLCEYLQLPRAYYRLKLRKRSSMRANSRESNFKMNELLSQMIEEGLFEPGVDWNTLSLQHFIDLHELEEKGITRENLKEELRALVQLLQDRLRFKKVQKIERS